MHEASFAFETAPAAMLKRLEPLRSDRRAASPCALALTLACCCLVGCATRVRPNASYSHSSDSPENPAMQPVPDNPSLPRVLLIGDSISIGYTLPVRQQLAGTANVHRIPENGGPTTLGLAKLEAWLGTNRWDVIHFNWGLHDLKLQPDGRHLVPVAEYEQNLSKLVARLQGTGAVLIWATTTPVPPAVKGPARNPADVALYNAVALRVMRPAGVRINDLYGFAERRRPRIQVPQNVHFTAEGSAQLAQPVVRAIRGALKDRRHRAVKE